MLLLGLVIAGAVGAFAGLLFADNTIGGPGNVIVLPGHHLVALNTMQAFIYGIALALVFCLGLAAMRHGAATLHRRHVARDTELREAGRVRAERDALAARLGIPIDRGFLADHGFLDEADPTAPLPPTAYPWSSS